MKILLIGGTGHIASYLIKDLIKFGAEVTAVSRGSTVPYENQKLFSKVRLHTLDREKAENGHAWEIFMASQKWDIVVDFIAFEPRSAEISYKTLRNHVKHYIFISTCWMYGETGRLPAVEDISRMNPGIPYAKKKLAIYRYFMGKFQKDKFPVTTINPTQITGPGKTCINPLGNHDMVFFEEMASVKRVVIPVSTAPFVQHVHPKDIAQLIFLCIQHPQKSIGQMFNASSPYAMDYLTYAHWVAQFVGNPKLKICAEPYEEYLEKNGKDDSILQHMKFPSCVSIEKAKYVLGYKPEFTAEQAVASCLEWHVKTKRLNMKIGKV